MHDRTYRRLGAEAPGDLAWLCRRCRGRTGTLQAVLPVEVATAIYLGPRRVARGGARWRRLLPLVVGVQAVALAVALIMRVALLARC